MAEAIKGAAFENMLAQGGDMGQLMQSYDWAQTPLGPRKDWPQALRTVVSVMLNAQQPMFVLWGSQLVTLYNDSYRAILGDSDRLETFGEPAREVWPEVWETIGPTARQAISKGIPAVVEGLHLGGYRDDREASFYDTVAYTPIPDGQGATGGLLCTCRNTTSASSASKVSDDLKVSRRQLELALQAGRIGSWRLELASNQLVASSLCKANYGLPAEVDFTYQVLMNRIHPDDKAWVTADMQKTIATGCDYDVEYRTIWDDGSTHWVIARAYLSCDEEGLPQRMVGISIDITARKRAEEAIKESEQRFRRVVESSVFGIMFADVEGKITYANRYIIELLGYSADEYASGKVRWNALTPPEFLDLDSNAIEQARAGGVCLPYKKAYRCKDGRQIPVLVGGAMLQEPFDQTQEGIGFVLDLTDIEAVTEQRDRFFNLSPDMFAIANAEGYFTYVNPTWEKILGYTPSEMLAQPYLDFVHPDDRAATIAEAQSLSVGDDLINFENRYRCKDGSYRWLAWNATSLSKQNQIYAIARDITASKKFAAEREQLLYREQVARESAEQANRIKDEFLAVVSHELRTPLNPILGWSQLLRTQNLNPAQTQKALETIERNAQLQVQLIGDLLDISKMLRGKISLTQSPVEMSNILTDAIETVQQLAAGKNIEITATASPCTVIGDAARLQQIIWNLLSNAIKFTPEGGQVSVTLAAEGTQAKVEVADNGKGIQAEFLPHVFEHFRQEDYSTTRQFGGLGLGLAIVRQMVELHNGSVTVESPGENQGATFSVYLPLSSSTPLPSDELSLSAGDLTGIRVLLVDDEPDAKEVAAYALAQGNADVTVADSGKEALQAFRRSVPDVLISDIGMAEMDGYMLIKEIRALPPEQGGDVLAIALTAYAGEADRQQSISAGYQRHLAKPIDPDALITAVRELL